MKPFEEAKLLGEALAELRETPPTDEELQEDIARIAGYFANDEEAACTIAAGIRYGLMPKE